MTTPPADMERWKAEITEALAHGLFFTPSPTQYFTEIQKGQQALIELLAYTADIEHQLEFTERDFAPLKQDYATLREENEKLVKFVERVAITSSDFGNADYWYAHWVEIAGEARALLAKLAESKSAPTPKE